MTEAGTGTDRSVTVVEAELPAEKFALSETFATLPEVGFRSERIVACGDRSVMPLVWTSGADREALDPALGDDPSVEDAAVVTTVDDELLYRMEWTDRVRTAFRVVTNSHATVLDTAAADGTWTFRVLYSDREALSRARGFRADHGLELDVRSVGEMDAEEAGRFGLTSKQREVLTTARERGYFEVPRRVELATLSAELDVSHQALSERLRRAQEALIRDTLLDGSQSADP